MQLRKILFSTGWIALASLFGCASEPPRIEPQDFTTWVDEDGSKRFLYVASGSSRSRAAPGPNVLTATLSFDQIEEGMGHYLRAQGYCDRGYFLYDRQYDGTLYRMSGECHESVDE